MMDDFRIYTMTASDIGQMETEFQDGLKADVQQKANSMLDQMRDPRNMPLAAEGPDGVVYAILLFSRAIVNGISNCFWTLGDQAAIEAVLWSVLNANWCDAIHCRCRLGDEERIAEMRGQGFRFIDGHEWTHGILTGRHGSWATREAIEQLRREVG